MCILNSGNHCEIMFQVPALIIYDLRVPKVVNDRDQDETMIKLSKTKQ